MIEQQTRWFDDLGREFARIAAQHEKGAQRRTTPRPSLLLPATRRGAIAAALSALALLVGGAYAVPTTRAAIDDVTGAFAGWVAGDETQAPGRAARPGDEAPDWVRADGGRLIAETDGVGLYVTRTGAGAHGTLLTFTLGNGNAVFDTIDGWRERFRRHAVVVLGTTPPGADSAERVPLLGVTARSVRTVELRYQEGPPLVAEDVDGGFVLMADSRRHLREIVAFDAAGRVLERADLSDAKVTPFGP
jgi:hypothetical protein